jgi:Ni,Fe-hydrogenase maturation factor
MKILVIGYGNTLRGDDAVGPLVAEQVANWNWPEVRSVAVHQLTPELAADIAQIDAVFFIDAAIAQPTQSPPELGDLGGKCNADEYFFNLTPPHIQRLFPDATPSSLDHTWSPGILLQLAKQLYGAEPIAYQLLIPARQFDYGQPLSTIAQNGLDCAITILQEQMKVVSPVPATCT